MATTIDDVKTETESSTVSSSEGVDSQKDVAVDSSSTDGAGQTEKTLSDIVNNSFKELTSSVDSEKPEKEVGTEETPTPETKVESEKVETETETKQKDEDKGPIPYERFQQTIQEKNQLAEQLQQVEPLLQAQRSINEYCSSNGLTQEEFGQWIEIAALVKNDPEQAWVKLQPFVEQFKQLTGEALPTEYQKAVDNGELTLDYAKRLAAAEKKQEFVQKRAQLTQAQQAQQSQLRFQNELKQSLASWVQNKISSSVDFRPKASANEPDGLYELFLNKFAMDAQASKVASPSDLIAVAERSLTAIKSSVSRFSPTRSVNGQKVLRSSQANSTEQVAPKTLKDVVQQAAARHGL